MKKASPRNRNRETTSMRLQKTERSRQLPDASVRFARRELLRSGQGNPLSPATGLQAERQEALQRSVRRAAMRAFAATLPSQPIHEEREFASDKPNTEPRLQRVIDAVDSMNEEDRIELRKELMAEFPATFGDDSLLSNLHRLKSVAQEPAA